MACVLLCCHKNVEGAFQQHDGLDLPKTEKKNILVGVWWCLTSYLLLPKKCFFFDRNSWNLQNSHKNASLVPHNRRINLFVQVHVHSFVNFQSTQGSLAAIITIIESLFTINFPALSSEATTKKKGEKYKQQSHSWTMINWLSIVDESCSVHLYMLLFTDIIRSMPQIFFFFREITKKNWCLMRDEKEEEDAG